MYNQGTKTLHSKYSHQLPLSTAIIQIAWQPLLDPQGEFNMESEGAETALPCILALLLTDRVQFLSPTLGLISTVFIPNDIGYPTSCLWIGPSLLISTSSNQLLYVGFDGNISHAASLLMGPAVSLLGATGDRILLSYKDKSGKTEVASRAWDPMPMMLIGWAILSSKDILPGGGDMARKAIMNLLASYDATKIPISILERLSALGFSDLAAAAATCSELPSVSDFQKSALKAAAGDWEPIVQQMMLQYEESEYYPGYVCIDHYFAGLMF